MSQTLALNPVSGVVHLWGCGLGPARGGTEAPFADGYVSVPASVLASIRVERLCRCLRKELG